VTVVDVNLSGKTDHIRLVPKEEVKDLIPTNADATGVLLEPIADTIPESINAPIKKGDVIGQARVMYAGQELQVIDLVAGEDVSRNFFMFIGYLIKTILGSTAIKLILGVTLLLAIFYVTVNTLYNMGVKKKKIFVVKNYRNINKPK
ncbi:MAG: hypothetical protein LBH71_01625, partial [Oscillospiraceae bacterium]|nr:hypothetical protein [Oscillospiraceae bacterium]